MTVAKLVAAGILFGSAGLWQPVQAQSTAVAPAAGYGASVAPPPAPVVEEIVADPSATVSAPADLAPVREVRPARKPRSTVASRVVVQEEATVAPTVGPPVLSTALPDDTRVVPLHVAQKRAQIGSFRVPPGYRPAWEDDRLNPQRASGTLGGREAMNDVWTTTVPRRLINRFGRQARKAQPVILYPIEPAVTGTAALATAKDDRTARTKAYGAGVGR